MGKYPVNWEGKAVVVVKEIGHDTYRLYVGGRFVQEGRGFEITPLANVITLGIVEAHPISIRGGASEPQEPK